MNKKAQEDQEEADAVAKALNQPETDELGVSLFALINGDKKKDNKTKKEIRTDKFLHNLTTSSAKSLVTKTDAVLTTFNKENKQPSIDQIANEELILLRTINDYWLNGIDPFICNLLDDKTIILPNETNAQQSSLIEMKDFTNHFYFNVQTNSKLLFQDNAPKYASDISHLYPCLNYNHLIQTSLEYRSKHLVPTAFQKPISLLGKSERIVSADEKYDDDARQLGAKLDEERNSIESIFIW
jgi:hypothetical protein